ncbi:CPBP family intramembrane glutamic endopeptidase [Eubacterium xylanophilum]|uniref:CPBP family intramembrane glutamic endopeptidase n=1 Tax=Eubacterium xylanophilum TaxID=39497 RepID=UPI00047939D4|nr:type II CAAX endopeptidase family protein [Eubacterium xylanophilum]
MEKFKSLLFAGIYVGIIYVFRIYITFLFAGQALVVSFQRHNMNLYDQMITKYVDDYTINIYLTGMIDLIIVVGFGLWYYYIRKKKDMLPVSYDKSLAAKPLLINVLMGVLAQFATVVIILAVVMVSPGVIESYNDTMQGMDMDNVQPAILILVVCIIGPIGEELVFRGMIYRTLRKGLPAVAAMIISGILFGIYHEQLVQGIYTAIFGFVLALVFEKTNSVLPSIVMHITYNSFNYIFEQIRNQLGLPEEIQGILTILFGFASMIVLIVTVIYYYRLDLKPVPQVEQVEEG